MDEGSGPQATVRLIPAERPPGRGIAQGQASKQFRLRLNGKAHSLQNRLAYRPVGLPGTPQLEQVVALPQVHFGKHALAMGVGYGVLGHVRDVRHTALNKAGRIAQRPARKHWSGRIRGPEEECRSR